MSPVFCAGSNPASEAGRRSEPPKKHDAPHALQRETYEALESDGDSY